MRLQKIVRFKPSKKSQEQLRVCIRRKTWTKGLSWRGCRSDYLFSRLEFLTFGSADHHECDHGTK